MAELITAVPPKPVSITDVESRPVRSSAVSPAQEYDMAVESGDPKLMLQVAQVNANTPVGVAATHVADLFYKGEQAVNSMMAPIEKKGGIVTPEGRLEAAKVAQTFFKQDEPKYFDAFIHALTGNKKMAQAMLTGGDLMYNLVVDKNGDMYQVGTNALGLIVDAQDITGRKISRQEFKELGIGRQKYENTLDYISRKQIAENNTEEWNKKIKRDSIAEQTYNGVIAPLAMRMHDDLEYIRNLDISPAERAKLFRFVNQSYGAASSSSEGTSQLDQAQANAATNAGKDVQDNVRVRLGLPAGLYQYTTDGLKNMKTGESFSFDKLRQMQSTTNKSNEINNKYNEDRASLNLYLKTTGLSKEQQDRVLRVMDAGKEIGMAMLKLQQEGAPRFLFTPNTSDAEDPYTLLQGKTVQLLTNQKLLDLNKQYSEAALKMSQRDGGLLPNPFDIEAGLSRTPQFRGIVDQGMQLTNEIVKRSAQTRTVNPTRPGAGVVPPTRQSNAQPTDQEMAADVLRLTNARTRELERRGAPVINEVPNGYERSGKTTPEGEVLVFKKGSPGRLFRLGDVTGLNRTGVPPVTE